MFGEQQCLSVEKAAQVVRQGEEEICPLLTKTPVHARPLMVKLAALFWGSGDSIGVLSTDGLGFTAILGALLGNGACKDSLASRPPIASRIVFERWQMPAGNFQARILWNGKDVSSQLAGCQGKPNYGCD